MTLLNQSFLKQNYIKPSIILAFFLMSYTQANTIEDDEIDAEFLEFLAEVDEATGDGFDTWLATTTKADNAIDTTNDKENKE